MGYQRAVQRAPPTELVCRSVCHTSEPCKNGCTDRDAVWAEDLGGPKEPCIRWGPDPPWEGAILDVLNRLYRVNGVSASRVQRAPPTELVVLLGLERYEAEYERDDGGHDEDDEGDVL